MLNFLAKWLLAISLLAGAPGHAATWVKLSGTSLPARSLTVAVSTTNYNVFSAAVANGWNSSTPAEITVTINSGVVIGSSSTSSPAFDTGTGFPVGTKIVLINNGSVVGKGGNGGAGGTAQSVVAGAGTAGGPALRAQYAISITNNGVIGGGGGGGGGGETFTGDSCGGEGCTFVSLISSAGGGGAGYVSGAGGLSPTTLTQEQIEGNYTLPHGGTGALTTGGAGGWVINMLQCNWGASGGRGGSGGNLGSAGGAGDVSAQGGITSINHYYGPGQGGAAGSATIGNANITWIAPGNRYGPLN